MRTTHIIITPKNKIWVAESASQADALRLNGKKAKTIFCTMPKELKDFFQQNPEEKSLFTKAFAYWIHVKAKGKQENQKLYGMLKRKLFDFSKKLFRRVRNIANSIAKKVLSFWHHQNKIQKQEKRMKRKYSFA